MGLSVRLALKSMSPGRGLDLFSALVASVQTGFGPFVAVYLASEAWTQQEIGAALSLGTIAAMLSQVPAGAAVDATSSKRVAAFVACVAVAASALLLAVWPVRGPVLLAEVLHGFASCMLGPAIAAVSLQMAGRAGFGERLGRNARWAALGSGAAAAVMGVVGSWSEAAVFWLTAALMGPALLALGQVRVKQSDQGDAGMDPPEMRTGRGWAVVRDWRVLGLALCVGLFHLGNAAVLPLVSVGLTRSSGSRASLVIAACIVLPQLLVAAISPWVGRAAGRVGVRALLVVAMGALPLRAGLLAVVGGWGPVPVVLVQLLDGLSAAGLGVLLPLVVADLTRGTGRFNLVMGALGLAAALGATVSTGAAGFVADRYGMGAALWALAGAGALATVAVGVGPVATGVRAAGPHPGVLPKGEGDRRR